MREDGTIFYPFVGQAVAAGKTARDIQIELADKLSAFIESPQLDVRVVTYRSQRFYVTGMVSRPRHFSVTDVPVRIVEALDYWRSSSGGRPLRCIAVSRRKNIQYPAI